MTARAPITVRSAEISTATVEIKTVTVNRKQMTLAMFRQLRDEPLISEDGKLNGNPWGSVNYHPPAQVTPPAKMRRWLPNAGDCLAAHPGHGPCSNDHGSHLHIIWQHGDELLKSLVHERDWCGSHHYITREHWGPTPGALIQGYFCASGHRELPEWAQLTEGDLRVIFSCGGVECGAEVPSTPYGYGSGGRPGWARYAPPDHGCTSDLDALGSQLIAEVARVKAEADAEDARRQRYTASWQAISDLPQLFIAA
jgi:hypothetical protein